MVSETSLIPQSVTAFALKQLRSEDSPNQQETKSKRNTTCPFVKILSKNPQNTEKAMIPSTAKVIVMLRFILDARVCPQRTLKYLAKLKMTRYSFVCIVNYRLTKPK